MITAYKLFRVRRDGSIGPLFIDRKARLPLGVWMRAGANPTKGFAFRPGWHCARRPVAPHLKVDGRAWFVVEVCGFLQKLKRPEAQGGEWLLAERLRIIRRYQV
jgi:hypothetical protein